MSVRPVTAFRATDGTLFATEGEAQSHEYATRFKAEIAGFINTVFWPYPANNGVAPSMAAKIIPAWEAYKDRKS